MPDAGTLLPAASSCCCSASASASSCPVVVFYLMIFNIVPYKKLRAELARRLRRPDARRSAIATPDWSPVTMGALFVALVRPLRGAACCSPASCCRKRIAEQQTRCVEAEPRQLARELDVHEMGITQGILAASFDAAEEAGATRITEIRISVGELTEIVGVRAAVRVRGADARARWPRARRSSSRTCPRSSRCLDCGAEYEHDRFQMVCPKCEQLQRRAARRAASCGSTASRPTTASDAPRRGDAAPRRPPRHRREE